MPHPPMSPNTNSKIANALTTLNLQPRCTAKDIKLSYRVLVLRYHPDKSRTPATTARFLAVQDAYEILQGAGYLQQEQEDVATGHTESREEQTQSTTSRPTGKPPPTKPAPTRGYKIFTPSSPYHYNIWAKHQRARDDQPRAEKKAATSRTRSRRPQRPHFSVFNLTESLWETRMRNLREQMAEEQVKFKSAGMKKDEKANAGSKARAQAAPAAERASKTERTSKVEKRYRKPDAAPVTAAAKASSRSATGRNGGNGDRGRNFTLYACSTVFWLCLLPGCQLMFQGLWRGRWDIGLLGMLLCESNDWLWYAMLKDFQVSRMEVEV